MQTTPNEEAWESKFGALPFFSEEEQLKQGRELYKRYLEDYPTAANRWCEYIDLEMKYGTRDDIENIFRKCLVQVPDVEIVKRYIRHIFNCFDDKASGVIDDHERAKFKKIQQGAYSLAIKLVGLDINSASIYKEFVEFLSESQSNEYLLKRLMFDISRIPMVERQELFAHYEEKLDDEQKKEERAAYEVTKTSHLRLSSYYQTIEKLKNTHGIDYCTKSKSFYAKQVLESFIDILDYETTLDGQPRYMERNYVSNGKDQRYEICPRSLEMKAQQERIYYMMNKMLLTFYRYPQAWLICAQHFQRRGNIGLALTLLRRGRCAVNCPILKMYEAFCLMLQGNTEQGLQLLSDGSDLEQVCKLKLAGRGFGMNGFRKVVREMEPYLKPYGFIAAAEVEYFMFGRKTAALKIFQEALKKYSNNSRIIKSYHRFLQGITPSRFIPNALRTYGDEQLDKYMKEAIEIKFKGKPQPKDTQIIRDVEKMIEENGERIEEQQILSESLSSQLQWRTHQLEIKKEVIQEFISILPPAKLYVGVKIDVDKLMDVVSGLIN